MTNMTLKREPRVLAAGSLLILVGFSLLLDRLDVVSLRWDKIFWVAGVVLGGFFAVDGLLRKKRGRTFWGSTLFFISLYFALLKSGIIERYDYPMVPVLFLAFGLGFLVLFFADTRETTLLIPAILFCGTGIVAILWWWEMVEWRDVRRVIETYWPLILILWGLALVVRRRRVAPEGESP